MQTEFQLEKMVQFLLNNYSAAKSQQITVPKERFSPFWSEGKKMI